jgi:hypothetical protein
MVIAAAVVLAAVTAASVGVALLLREPVLDKWSAKRRNERVKLLASFLNALALAMIVTGVVVPTVGNSSLGWSAVAWVAAGGLLHYLAHVAFALMVPEE